MILASALISGAAAIASPDAATDIVVEFISTVCLREGDRMTAAQRLIPNSWEMTRDEREEDVSYEVDAPVPEHDRVDRRWRGKIAGGGGALSFMQFDYSAPTQRDTWFAILWVWPSSLVDFADVQNRVSLRFRPSDQEPSEGVNASGGAGAITRPPSTVPPLYVAEIDALAQDVEITARHYPPSFSVDQESVFSCSNVTGPPDRPTPPR